MNVLHAPFVADILLLRPGESLRDQIRFWSRRHPERQVEMSLEPSIPEVRGLLRRAGAALVDATESPTGAADVFQHAVARLGANAVAMCSEAMHEGLELFVRTRGSLLILGSLSDEQWDEFFKYLLRAKRKTPTAWAPARRCLPLSHLGPRRKRWPERLSDRFRGGLDWPASDVN